MSQPPPRSSEKDLDRAPGTSPDDDIVVRELRADDLERMVRIDMASTGASRKGYYEKRLHAALNESGVRISLAAELDGRLVGFLLGRVYYGEYGYTEPVATIDTLGVYPEYRRRGIGHALLDQLVRNLRGLRVERVLTEVAWEQWDLVRFLHDRGFRPAPRIALELEI